ncbi:hypothetical protein GQ43DRAFT_436198 [Delitschia confertaspora ATCC 74209]|uniref:Uncharacterized protein n=1 Tax=Delitschia confertaspora ATCC 74209 TaxID=1513339 RepID=A0A9P4JBR7_9PLEO|nr:hypothetical protein GQ43DRAFT_436198 [Delitschia confertaspora ATCC 74209]
MLYQNQDFRKKMRNTVLVNSRNPVFVPPNPFIGRPVHIPPSEAQRPRRLLCGRLGLSLLNSNSLKLDIYTLIYGAGIAGIATLLAVEVNRLQRSNLLIVGVGLRGDVVDGWSLSNAGEFEVGVVLAVDFAGICLGFFSLLSSTGAASTLIIIPCT